MRIATTTKVGEHAEDPTRFARPAGGKLADFMQGC